jgi:hypothetical protein
MCAEMSKKYMGQIMAECDCQHMEECEAAGRCIAEEIKKTMEDFDNFMRLGERERWFILWEKAGMPT